MSITDKLALLNITNIPGVGRKRGKKVDKKYATFNRRMMAVTLDTLFLAVLIAPLVEILFSHYYGEIAFNYSALVEQAQMQPTPHEAASVLLQGIYNSGALNRFLINNLIQILVILLYSGTCWHYWSATPGKIIMRLRVVDAETEAPISDKQILLRLVGYVVAVFAFCIGVFWIGVDKRRQGWHDKMAGTVVIVLPWKKKVKLDSEVADQ